MVLEDRMRKGEMKVGYGKYTHKVEKKKYSLPYATAVCFVLFFFSFYAGVSEENPLKISKPEVTDIHFYIHVRAFLIALSTGLSFGLGSRLHELFILYTAWG